MRDVFIIGVGMTRFDKHLSLSVKDLAAQALQQALDDAGITSKTLEAAWFSNTAWGYFSIPTQYPGAGGFGGGRYIRDTSYQCGKRLCRWFHGFA